MLVNSFRPRDDQFSSGWWTAFFNPFTSSWTIQNYTQALTTDTAGIPLNSPSKGAPGSNYTFNKAT